MLVHDLGKNNTYQHKYHSVEDLILRLQDKLNFATDVLENRKTQHYGDEYVGFDIVYPSKEFAGLGPTVLRQLGSAYEDFEGPLLEFEIKDRGWISGKRRTYSVYVYGSIKGCEKIQSYPDNLDLPDLLVLDGYRLKGFIVNEHKVIPLQAITITWNTLEHKYKLLAIDEINNDIINDSNVFKELRYCKGWTVFGDIVAECNGFLLYMYEPDYKAFEQDPEDRWMKFAGAAYSNSSNYSIYQDGECIYGKDFINDVTVSINTERQKIQDKIDKLKQVTVSRGATEHEEVTAKRKIELLTNNMLHVGDTVSTESKEQVKADIIVPKYRQGLYGHSWHIEYGGYIVNRGTNNMTVYEFLDMLEEIVNTKFDRTLGVSDDIRNVTVSAIKARRIAPKLEFGTLWLDYRGDYYMFNTTYKRPRSVCCIMNKIQPGFKHFSEAIEEVSTDQLMSGWWNSVEMYEHVIKFQEFTKFVNDKRNFIPSKKYRESDKLRPDVNDMVVCIADSNITEKHGSVYKCTAINNGAIELTSNSTFALCYRIPMETWDEYKSQRYVSVLDVYVEYALQFAKGATHEAIKNFNTLEMAKELQCQNRRKSSKCEKYGDYKYDKWEVGNICHLPRYLYTPEGKMIREGTEFKILEYKGKGRYDILVEGIEMKDVVFSKRLGDSPKIRKSITPNEESEFRRASLAMKHMYEDISGVTALKKEFD